MTRPFLHRLIAVLCLLTTSFHAVAGGFAVQCRESDGTTHLEWGGCGIGEAGRCGKPCGPLQPSESESQNSSPCEDTPVKVDVGTATSRSACSPITVDLPLPVFAIIAFPIEPLSLNMLMRRVEVRAAAPPPAMASIRTIVMLM